MTIPACRTNDKRLCYESTESFEKTKASQTGTKAVAAAARQVAATLLIEAGAHQAGHAAVKYASKGAGAIAARTAAKAGGEAAAQAAERAVKTAARIPVNFALAALAGYKGTILLHKVIEYTNQEGRDLNKALVGQNLDVSVLMIAAQSEPGLVSAGYLQHKAALVGAKENMRHPSQLLATDITGRAANKDLDAMEVRDAVVQAFREGKEVVYDRYITNQQALDQALKDPAVADRFQKDPVFKQGMLAAMDEATRCRANFDKGAEEVATRRHAQHFRP